MNLTKILFLNTLSALRRYVGSQIQKMMSWD